MRIAIAGIEAAASADSKALSYWSVQGALLIGPSSAALGEGGNLACAGRANSAVAIVSSHSQC